MITLYKAQSTGVGEVPDLDLRATETVPTFVHRPDDDCVAFYEAQADAIVDALRSSLPGGTVDRVLVKLLDAKASMLRVPL